MTTNDQFSRYRALVERAARAALGIEARAGEIDDSRGAGVRDETSMVEASAREAASGAEGDAYSLAIALPAARLLLEQSREDDARLARSFTLLAALGRPWVKVGVAGGALGALVDDPAAVSSRAKVEALLADFAQGDAATGGGGAASSITVPMRDGAGHARDVYHPLAVHLCLAAFERRYESIPQQYWSTCEQAVLEATAPCRLPEFFADAAPPPDLVPLVLFQSLCLAEAGKLLSRDVDIELVDSVVHAIVAEPRDGLHDMVDGDTLDTWTYRELTGLHALANLALARRNTAWARRVEQIALFHLENTQPDNTTNQPWAVFAFLWSPKTRSFAEQQLHDVTVHGSVTGGRVNELAGMLLADATNALAEF